MNSATFLKSSCTKPLEVRAGEPNLRPLGRKALLSPTETHISQHSTGKIRSFTLINEAKKESVQPAGGQGLRLNIRVKQQDTLPGQVFLLQAMAQASRTFSARPPSVPLLRRSSRIRWLSEPPKENQINVLENRIRMERCILCTVVTMSMNTRQFRTEIFISNIVISFLKKSL